MGKDTMSIAIPPELRMFVESRVSSGEYGNTSEYFRELVRRDKRDQAVARLRAMITEGFESGPATPLTSEDIEDIRQRAGLPRTPR